MELTYLFLFMSATALVAWDCTALYIKHKG